ncbi:MAG TPA: PDZ domain-containing protein, partial [Gemmatimonadaceae bacterium]|nr:PDZ domain-containing protein [Gemmatimonadaceae bacterium]
MKTVNSRRLHAIATVVLSLASFACAQQAAKVSCAAGTTEYEVSLQGREKHILRVRAVFAPSSRGERTIQLPVWNATYQVRDFAQNVFSMFAEDEQGKPLSVMKIEKSLWRIAAPRERGCVAAEYEIYLDEAGPFSAQVNAEHAFINWAQALVYSPEERGNRVRIRVVDLPSTWKVRDAYVFANAAEAGALAVDGEAANYDMLVDSPVEMGTFAETTITEGGARYQVVVHGDATAYDMKKLSEALQKLAAAETDWMQDRPFDRYTFIYHFPRGPAGGGMEHSYSTAIDVSADRIQQNPLAFASVSAHEFFHLWNVKRIRPATLEPVDYAKEMYTRALWFSEGVTSAVQEYMLVRSGLNDEATFLQNLGRQISTLQERPAHQAQSVEESSLDAWLEKYPFYAQPDRSISYYNKGQIVGVLLDLKIREATHGAKSLRDVFHYLNENYAKKHLYFDDSEGIRKATEAVSGADLRDFFSRYVAGTEEIPYDEFLRGVGLRVVKKPTRVPYAGFTIGRAIGRTPTIATVDPGSPAEQAGVAVGDVLVAVNGKLVTGNANAALSALQPGELATLKFRGRSGDR